MAKINLMVFLFHAVFLRVWILTILRYCVGLVKFFLAELLHLCFSYMSRATNYVGVLVEIEKS